MEDTMTKAAATLPICHQARNDPRNVPFTLEEAATLLRLTPAGVLLLADQGKLVVLCQEHLLPRGKLTWCRHDPARGPGIWADDEGKYGASAFALWARIDPSGRGGWLEIVDTSRTIDVNYAVLCDSRGDSTYPNGNVTYESVVWEPWTPPPRFTRIGDLRIRYPSPPPPKGFPVRRSDLYFVRHRVEALAREVKVPDEPPSAQADVKEPDDLPPEVVAACNEAKKESTRTRDTKIARAAMPLLASGKTNEEIFETISPTLELALGLSAGRAFIGKLRQALGLSRRQNVGK